MFASENEFVDCLLPIFKAAAGISFVCLLFITCVAIIRYADGAKKPPMTWFRHVLAGTSTIILVSYLFLPLTCHGLGGFIHNVKRFEFFDSNFLKWKWRHWMLSDWYMRDLAPSLPADSWTHSGVSVTDIPLTS